MTLIHHPTLPSSKEVPDSDVQKWTDSGWLTDEPDRTPVATDYTVKYPDPKQPPPNPVVIPAGSGTVTIDTGEPKRKSRKKA